MALPALNIPEFPLPFNIPIEIHPCVVHLAIALPMVIVLMELVNLVVKKRTLGVFSFVLMILLSLILFGAYLTGSVDAEHAKSALSGEAKTLFEAHKLQGVYLVYGAAVLVLIKLLSVLIRKTPMRVIFLIFLLAFTALTVNTAKKGKELVFDYGINVKTAGAAGASTPATPQASTPKAAEETPAETKPKAEESATQAAPKEETKAPEAPKEETAAPAPETPAAEANAKPAQETTAEPEAQADDAAQTPPHDAPEAPQAPEGH